MEFDRKTADSTKMEVSGKDVEALKKAEFEVGQEVIF